AVQPRRLALGERARAADRGAHESFTLAEIEEQPRALRRTLRAAPAGPGLDELPWVQLSAARRLTIIACGTSYHAGLAGRHLLERWAGLRVEVDVASE